MALLPSMQPATRRRKMTSSLRLWTVCIVANLGGFLVGVHLALFSGILEMRSFANDMSFEITAASKSYITCALVVGFLAGAIPAGPLCDLYGRKVALVTCAILFLVSTIATSAATSLNGMLYSRFVSGLAYAVANVTCAVYTAEISPVHMRGILVNLYQLLITMGIFAAQCMNVLIWEYGNWKTVVWIATIPAILMAILVWFVVPESSVWLSAAERKGVEGQNNKWSVLDVIKDASGRRRLMIGGGLAACQQLTGINSIIFFGPALLGDVMNMKEGSAPFMAAAFIGCVNVIATLASLAVVERFGRKVLLVGCSAPMVVSLLIVGGMKSEVISLNKYVGVGALAVFVVCFAISYGPIPFLVIAEIYPIAYKGIGVSWCNTVFATLCIGLGAAFLPMLRATGGFVFATFAVCVALSALFVHKVVPETRNLTLEELELLLAE